MNGTRRKFLGCANGILTGGLASRTRPLAAATHGVIEGEDYYDKLGVSKIINAAGTYTVLTASTMPPPVQAAVARSAKHPVRLLELQKAAGEYIAKQLRCEAALVSAGASSALTLGMAGCLAVGNKIGILQIPNDVGKMKNEVIIQKAHRYGYDHALEVCGARFVEVETLQQYEAAFTDRTVMAHYFNAAEHGQIGREDWIRVAHSHGVPCFNDAAADVPPTSNLYKFTQMGFDLVAFSGGKGMRGPQNAGLLLGKKELIEAAVKNNNPFDGVGRGMKVAKEQIVGMVAALDWFLAQSEDAMQAEFRKRAERIAAQLKKLPGVETQIVVPSTEANAVPHLLVRCDHAKVKLSPREAQEELRRGTPSIELNPATGRKRGGGGLPSDENTIVVGVWMLEPGEDLIVARRLREVLSKAANA
jgi:L-seryl-tRNA(Ser) seleniumtransferase